jgi:L-lactate dehydrogenase
MIGSAAGTTKVAVVGAGSVGATLAYACLVRGIGRTIALYDVDADKTRAEVLDSSRLRLLVAEHCGVAVQSVHAYIAGEHGDSETPLWSSASIGSVPLLAWDVPGRPPLDAATRDEIVRRVIGSAGEIIRGKGATNYAVGLAAARIIEAVLDDQRQVLPVSSLLDGRAGIGIHDVCLSLPSVVDRHGVDTVLPGPLSEDEAEGLRRSADTVRGVIKRLGL